MTQNQKNEDFQLVVERSFRTNSQILWDVHSKTEHLVNWWGPQGFHMEILNFEFTEGGKMHYRLFNDEGHEMYGLVHYIELNEPDLMVFISSFADENGNIIRHPMADTWPLKLENYLSFKTEGEECKLILKARPFEAGQAEVDTFNGAIDSVQGGFKGMLDNLEEYLKEL